MSTNEITPDKMIISLADIGDIRQVLNAVNMTPLEAMEMLGSPEGRRSLQAHTILARIQSRLVAQKFSPWAVQQLCTLLQDEKPEVRMKGALSILDVAGFNEEPAPAKDKPAEDAPAMESAEVTAILKAVAETMESRKTVIGNR